MPEKKEETLDQWLIAQTLSTAVMVLNAPFCDGGPAEGPNFEYLDYIINHLASHCGLMALEDAQTVIDAAVDRATLHRMQGDAIAAEQVIPLSVVPSKPMPKFNPTRSRVHAAMQRLTEGQAKGERHTAFAFPFEGKPEEVTDALEYVESFLDRHTLVASAVRHSDGIIYIEGISYR